MLPVTLEAVPSRHWVQDSTPVVDSEYVPGGQLVQESMEVPPVPNKYLPFGQAVHCAAPVEEYVPPGQAGHELDVRPVNA